MGGSDDRTVLISGAGIGGLTTALALTKKGWKVWLFEKAPTLEPIGAGIQLSPNAWNVLADLGLSEQLQQYASFPEAIILHDGRSGRQLTSLPLGETFERKFGLPYGVIHRGDLHTILIEACNQTESIGVSVNKEVASVELGDKQGAFWFSDCSRITGDLLIAADGIHSSIRQEVGNPSPAIPSGKIAWRTMISSDRFNSDWLLRNTTVWLAPDHHVVTYPVSGGELLNVILIAPDTGQTDAVSPDLSNSKFSDHLLGLFSLADEWGAWPLLETPGPYTFSKGRLALVGDATHGMMPFAAQGAAMAIEDSAVLTACLDQDTPIDVALRDYHSKRIDRVTKVARLAKSNGRIYHLPAALGFFRNLGMRMIPGSLLMARQSWVYGWKPEP